MCGPTCALLRGRAGANVDVIHKDVTSGAMVEHPLQHHLGEEEEEEREEEEEEEEEDRRRRMKRERD